MVKSRSDKPKKQHCKSGDGRARGSVKGAESVQVSGAVLVCKNTCVYALGLFSPVDP